MTETKGEYRVGGRVTSAPQQAVAELSGYYAQIPAELVAAKNANAILLYGVLDRIAGRPDCFASLARLCNETGLSVRTVQRTRDWLVEEGYLEVIHQGTGHRATDYHLPFRSLRCDRSGVSELPGTISQGSNSDTPGMSQSLFHCIKPSKRTSNESPSPEVSADATTSGEPPVRETNAKDVMTALEEIRGYKSANYGGEAGAAKWMLKEGLTLVDILKCYQHLKSEHFWVDKALTLMTVKGQIGEWKAWERKERPDLVRPARGGYSRPQVGRTMDDYPETFNEPMRNSTR